MKIVLRVERLETPLAITLVRKKQEMLAKSR